MVTRSRRAAAAEKAAEHAEATESSQDSAVERTAAPKPSPHAKPGAQENRQANAHTNAQSNTQTNAEPHNQHKNRQPSEAELARREAVAKFPFVAVSLGASGIHPATSRLITFDAVTYNAEGEIGEATHIVFSPDSDPGPKHQHGLTHEEVAAGVPFSKALKRVDRILDGRTLIIHDATVTWGFIVSEARSAMTAAARQNRSRNRNNRSRARRIKVGHIPRPVGIIDTLATARRQELVFQDVRLASVAIASGIAATPPLASVERAQIPAADTARAETTLLWQLHQEQARRGDVVELDPQELRADKFGLQRSHIRVDAMEAPRMHHNPGQYRPGKELVRGMEFVVAPEVAIDPDVLIEAAVREEMNYVEKLSRETSIVVCNVTTDLVGKAMHADRKDIPLMGDEAFLAALERIEEPGPEPVVEQKPTTAPRPQQRRTPASGSAPRRGGTSATHAPGGSKSATSRGAGAKAAAAGKAGSHAGGASHVEGDDPTNRPQRKSSRRRRRRRNPNANPAQKQQGQNQNQPHSQGQSQGQNKPAPAQKSGSQPSGAGTTGQQGNRQQGNRQQGTGQQPNKGNEQSGNKPSGRRRRRGGRGGRNRNRGGQGNKSANGGSTNRASDSQSNGGNQGGNAQAK